MNETDPRPVIRHRIRAARRAVSELDRTSWNSAICQRILETDSFKSANKVAGFLAFDGEADPLELMIEATKQGKQVFVPTIVAKGQPLMFVPWTKGCEMAKNAFGIFEPVVPRHQWVEACELDFVINPLVAFDDSCNRIGVGGGYYDRSFAFLNSAEPNARVPSAQLVGFAFELQKIETIKVNDWDVRLAGVATESSFYTCDEV